MSAFSLYLDKQTISGDALKDVPAASNNPVVTFVHNPKSSNFPVPSLAIFTFSSLRSGWTRPSEWRSSNPSTTPDKIYIFFYLLGKDWQLKNLPDLYQIFPQNMLFHFSYFMFVFVQLYMRWLLLGQFLPNLQIYPSWFVHALYKI